MLAPVHRHAATARRMLAAALAVASMFTVAACGGGGDGKTGSSSKTVNWWGWAPGNDLATKYLAAFKKDHPDIKVVYKEIPYGDYVNALRLGLRSSSGPDVYALQPGEITDRFGPSALDLTARAEKALGADWQSKVVGAAQKQFSRDGKQVGLPVQLSASGIYWYDKTLFDKYGLQPPTNLAELAKVCGTLASHSLVCMAQGAKDSWANIDFYMALAADTAPGAFYEAVDGKRSWTDPGLVRAFALWRQMFTDGVFGKGSAGLAVYPDTVGQFANGKAGMIMLGTWQAGFMDAAALKLGQEGKFVPRVMLPAAFPDVTGDGQQPKTFGGPDYGLAINARTDAEDASWTFVQWLATSQEGQTLIAGEKFVPAMQGVAMGDSNLVDPQLQKPALRQVVDFMANSEGYREIPYAEIKSALGDALAAVAVDRQTPEQAASKVEGVSRTLDRG